MILWKNILYPIAAGVIALLLFHCVFFVGYVPTASMEPTIPVNSLIVGNRVYGKLDVGDVVVFEWEGQLLVKRIYAAEGMLVEQNGTKVRVSKECFYMVGDNRDCSYDSRFWENPFIHQDKIIARVFLAQ